MKKTAIFVVLLLIAALSFLPITAVAQTPPPTPTGVSSFGIESIQSDWCTTMGGWQLLETPVTLYGGQELSLYHPDISRDYVVYVNVEMFYQVYYSFDMFLSGADPVYINDFYRMGGALMTYQEVFNIPADFNPAAGPSISFGFVSQTDPFLDPVYALRVMEVCAVGDVYTPTPAPTVTGTPPPTSTPHPTATPRPDDSMCINHDANFDMPPSGWRSYGHVTYSSGSAYIYHLSDILRDIPRNVETTSFEMQVDAWVGGVESMNATIYAGSLTHAQTFNNTAPQRFVYQFNASGDDIHVRFSTGGGSSDYSYLAITRVCIVPLETPATPTPTPTATPVAPSCENPDSGFDIPAAWTYNPTLVEITGGIMSASGGGAAYLSATLAAGAYHVEVRARPNVSNVSLAVELGDRNGSTYPGQDYIHLLDGWRTYSYDTDIYKAGSLMRISLTGWQSSLLQELPYGLTYAVDYICLTQTGTDATPTPAPTPLPGEPTLTPTPFDPAPVGCRNADAGLDTDAYWSVVGGTIAGSQAELIPGGQLFEDINYNSSLDYTVAVRGRAASGSGDVTVYFGGSGQTEVFGDSWEEHLYTFPSGEGSMLAGPLTQLLEENWVPGAFVSVIATPASPLATPMPPQAQGIMGKGVLYAADLLSVQSATYNAANIEISYICVKSHIPDTDPHEQITMFHPTCERDYALQTAFSANLLNYHPAIVVGAGAQGGMPVHAMHGGTVTRQDFSLLVGFTTYVNCLEIDHTAVFNLDVSSIYCGLTTMTVPGSGTIERGAIIGFTGDAPGDLVFSDITGGPGLVMVQLNVDGNAVDPVAYFNGYPDCRPYEVILENLEPCAADDGSGTIPPRNNDPAPSLWDASGWVPWLAGRLYDTVGYPILCSLVQLYNDAVALAEQIANAVLNAILAPFMFIYRIGRIFEFLIALWDEFWTQLFALYAAWDSAVVCVRSILVYFVTAIQASASASINIAPPQEGGWMIFGLNLALKIIGSTIANVLLIPLVILFCGYATWRLAPWGIRKLRQAFGLGEG